MIGGCNDTGMCFHGEVDDLITYQNLCTLFNVTEGILNITSQSNKWLHFSLDDKELYVSKIAVRGSISWDHLYSKGLVYGTDDIGLYPRGTATNQLKTITLNEKTYKCRLLKGLDPEINQGSTDGYDTVETQSSEWSRLFYPIITNDPNIASYTGPMLASYRESDLQMRWIDIGATPGSYNWCQERYITFTAHRLARGYEGPSYLGWGPSTTVNTPRGWRACLELV